MPTSLGKIFKSGRRRGEKTLVTMRVLRALLEKRTFTSRCELLLRFLRNGPFDLVALVYFRELKQGVVDATVMSILGSDERHEQLQDALSSSSSPLIGVTPDVPRRLSASADPFAPGVAFLRRRKLEWLLALPAGEPSDGVVGRPCLLLGGAQECAADDPMIESLLTAWGIYRQLEQYESQALRSSGGLSGGSDSGSDFWLQAPSPLALLSGREVVAMNDAAEELLRDCFGGNEEAANDWLKAAVVRLESSERTSDQLVASRRRTHRIEVTLGAATKNGRLVGLRDVTSEASAEDRRAATVSTLSHELRTPLASMKNSVGLVLNGETGELGADQERFLSMTMRNIDRLDRLIGDLLDVSRAHAGRLALRRETVDLGPLLREAMAMLDTTAQQRDISLDCSGLPESFPAHVDGDKIMQMVHNTVGNALKYTEDGGKIRVWLDSRVSSCSEIDRMLADRFFLPLKTFALVVEDNGMGMSTELLQNICSPFSRGDAAEESDAPGTGLGLHITRALVEAHGGRLVIDSELKIGTTVRVVLPRDPDSERVIVAAKRLAGAKRTAGRDVRMFCLDARRPDRELDEKELGRAGRFLAECLARIENESGAAEIAPPATPADGLWVLAKADGRRLHTAWEVARGAPGCPEQLRDVEWAEEPWPDDPNEDLTHVDVTQVAETVGAPNDEDQMELQPEDR